MDKKEKQEKYDKMLQEFEDGHRRLKYLKKEIAKLQAELIRMPNLVNNEPNRISKIIP